MPENLIRNFCIIAHIDHGKSTLADRLIEHLEGVDKRRFRNQFLDDMELERERGITIKASEIKLGYKYKDDQKYILNLIDTPGHVDFSYEVSKSLAACEGAILVIDASQGVEAQTMVNYHLAKERNLSIIPVINKIDLPSIDLPWVKQQIIDILKFKEEDIIMASAKEGIGIDQILEKIVEKIPAPLGDAAGKLQALVFDSAFDVYKGVVIYFRVMNGSIKKDTSLKFMQSGRIYKIEELGILKNLQLTPVKEVEVGDVGYITANIRQAEEIIIGDTITDNKNPADTALAGCKKIKPLVFCGIYPVNPGDFNLLKDAFAKLHLQDASFVFEPENSTSFGMGFRSGFLGLLHMEIIQERLEREFNLNLILTTPNVTYQVVKRDGTVISVDNPNKLPELSEVSTFEEPFVTAMVISPIEFIEDICTISKSRRGIHKASNFLGADRIEVIFELPLSEIIIDFYDKIKSLTKGYGSIDYEFLGFKPTKIVKLDILINGEICDAFSTLIFKEKAQNKGRRLVEKLKELIPKQVFEVSIQAAIGSQIIASEKISAMAKCVTAKCYGGDITRKRKLWEKQKEGKKRLKQFGKVEIPQEAFLQALKMG